MNPSWYAIIALSVSTLALVVATKNYRRKAGILVRGEFNIASSIQCKDRYVSNMLIENLKDRAITIFAIYLQVGHSYYIELEDFEEAPLILKAYETFRKQYGPIQLYKTNSKRVNMNPLLEEVKIQKRLVLSTSDGKYIIPSRIKRWSPIGDSFKNSLTATLRPVILKHKGKYIGENVRYIIDLINEDHQESILIYSNTTEHNNHLDFPLTSDSIESIEKLTAYLQKVKDEGALKCESFCVIDVGNRKSTTLSPHYSTTIEAPYHGFWEHHISGQAITWLLNRELKRINEKLRRRAAELSSETDK